MEYLYLHKTIIWLNLVMTIFMVTFISQDDFYLAKTTFFISSRQDRISHAKTKVVQIRRTSSVRACFHVILALISFHKAGPLGVNTFARSQDTT